MMMEMGLVFRMQYQTPSGLRGFYKVVTKELETYGYLIRLLADTSSLLVFECYPDGGTTLSREIR